MNTPGTVHLDGPTAAKILNALDVYFWEAQPSLFYDPEVLRVGEELCRVCEESGDQHAAQVAKEWREDEALVRRPDAAGVALTERGEAAT